MFVMWLESLRKIVGADSASIERMYKRLYGDSKLSKVLSRYLFMLIFNITLCSCLSLLSNMNRLLFGFYGLIIVLSTISVLGLGLIYVRYSDIKSMTLSETKMYSIIVAILLVDIILVSMLFYVVYMILMKLIEVDTVDEWLAIGNVLSFIVFLVALCYFRFRYKEMRNAFYWAFFFFYCVSVIYSFFPESVKTSVWDHILPRIIKSRFFSIKRIDVIILPAFKEAGLSFIILDTMFKTE